MSADDGYRQVAKQPEKKTLTQLIEQMKPEIGRALPRHMSPDRMARIATTALRQNPKLGKTTPESFLGAVMTASQLGLEPGPLGEAYLVPYGNVCQFIPGYRGLIKLAWQSDQLADIWAEVVYENDDFHWELGLRRDLLHTPAKAERGHPTHVYAAARLKSGGTPFVVMGLEEIEAIRGRSKSGSSGPWVTDWPAMAKKTAVKQLAKWLPMSSEFKLATIFDESIRTDLTHDLVEVVPNYIDGDIVEEPDSRAPKVRQLFAILNKGGELSRGDRIAVYRWITGNQTINSTHDLTAVELDAIVDQLQKWDKANTLVSQITDILNTITISAEPEPAPFSEPS